VEITSSTFPGQVFVGLVSFIDPFLNEETRTVRVRVDVPNPELKLKPGMFVNATLKIPIGTENQVGYYCPMHPEVESDKPGTCEKCGGMALLEKPQGVLAIPRSAVLDTGLRKIVYVEKETGVFLAREVDTGYEAEGYIQVLEGLMEGEKVAAAGAFLIDAETKLGPGVAAQYYGATGWPTEEAPHVHGAPAGTLPPLEEVKKLPEVAEAPPAEAEVKLRARLPGKGEAVDPVCGMTVKQDQALSLEYERKIYYFCSKECHTHFQSNPELFSTRVWAYTKTEFSDPVCGAEVEKTEAQTYHYRDKTYYFCCDECKRKFKKDPAKYLAN
jgi:YHS domain-containing protein